MEKKNTDSVKQTIIQLRHFGFFEQYKSLNDEQLFDTLHQQKIAYYSKIFERFYDPGMELEMHQILALDRGRTVSGDYESDVGKDNKQYVYLLKAFADASGQVFTPTDITEKWDSEEGPIHVSFKENAKLVSFRPTYQEDWLSEEAFEVVNKMMADKGDEKFYLYLGKDGWGLGQDFLYVRMNKKQKEDLQKTFGWQFSD